ncbi:MAG: MobQ family relaxase [Hyphomicrobiaceae bacterium]
MASYHLSAQIIGRSAGRSAIAAAAYRAGERLVDRATGQIHDYTRKRGIGHREVILPPGAPAWMTDRERLWNHAQARETRKDSQLAREINIALPHEITDGERLALVRAFVAAEFVAKGMVADIALHNPVPERGDDPRNYHAHIMLTLRQAGPDGLFKTKTRTWNARDELKVWRAAWAAQQNRVLGHGRAERVDHRSLADQRAEALEQRDFVRAKALDREPETHVGPEAMAQVKAGRKPQALRSPVPPPVTPPLVPMTAALPAPQKTMPRSVHVAETRFLAPVVVRATAPLPLLRSAPSRQPTMAARLPPVLRPPPPSKPFVRRTWTPQIPNKSYRTSVPFFRMVVSETRPRQSWRSRVAEQRMTRLEMLVTGVERSVYRAKLWVRQADGAAARALLRTRKWQKVLRRLRADGKRCAAHTSRRR